MIVVFTYFWADGLCGYCKTKTCLKRNIKSDFVLVEGDTMINVGENLGKPRPHSQSTRIPKASERKNDHTRFATETMKVALRNRALPGIT